MGLNIKKKKYPFKNDFVVSFTIDDIHPESVYDYEKLDFGCDFDNGPFKYLEQIVKEIPEFKFTLFVVPNRINKLDTPKGYLFFLRKIYRKRNFYKDCPFDITYDKHKDWIKKLNNFMPDNIELAIHGLEHHNHNLNLPSSQEFVGISKEEKKYKVTNMINKFKKSGLRFSFGFRPPGWGIDNELISILKSNEILYVASFSDFNLRITPSTIIKKGLFKGHSILYENFVDNKLLNFVANCYPYQLNRAIDIVKNDGILVFHSHIAKTQFGLIAINRDTPQYIKIIMNEISKQTIKQPWFATLEQLSKHLMAVDKLTFDIKDENTIIFNNNLDYDLLGFTVEINGKDYIIDKIDANSSVLFSIDRAVSIPKVSLVLTVFNGEKFIKDSLQSLISQTYENIEIIIVNDGSTDSTKEIIESLIAEKNCYDYVRLINQLNGGRANAKNVGLQNLSGEYVAFCEDDAIYHKDYITNAISNFIDDKIAGVIGPHYVLNKNDSINTRVKDIERRRNFYNYNPKSCWIYKTSVLRDIGGFNEKLEFGEDVEPAFRLAQKGYRFVYDGRCIRLHREPSIFFQYLKRKYKGGLGMALLQKLGLKKDIIPVKYRVILVILILMFLLICFYDYRAIIFFIFFVPILLLFIRFRDIILGLKVSNEKLFFIIFSIYVEYIWWISTFSGLIHGKFLSIEKINFKLRGRK